MSRSRPSKSRRTIPKLCADIDDVRAVAHLVLRHQVLTNFKARAEGLDTETLLDELIQPASAYWNRGWRFDPRARPTGKEPNRDRDSESHSRSAGTIS